MANDIEAAARALVDAVQAEQEWDTTLDPDNFGCACNGTPTTDPMDDLDKPCSSCRAKVTKSRAVALRAALAAPAGETDVEWLLRQMSKQDLRTLRDIAETFPRDRDAPKYALPAAPATGDAKPVAWERGRRPDTRHPISVEVCETSDLVVDDVVFHDGEWWVILDHPENDGRQVYAAPIIDDAGGYDVPDFIEATWFVRVVPLPAPASGAVEEARKAFYEACRAYEDAVAFVDDFPDDEEVDALNDAKDARRDACNAKNDTYRALLAAEAAERAERGGKGA